MEHGDIELVWNILVPRGWKKYQYLCNKGHPDQQGSSLHFRQKKVTSNYSVQVKQQMQKKI